MGFLDKIFNTKGVVKEGIEGIRNLADTFITTDEEKRKLDIELKKLNNEIDNHLLDLQQSEINAKKEIMVAEAKSNSKIMSSWRPIVGIMLAGIVVLVLFNNHIILPYANKAKALELPSEVWSLLRSLLTLGFIGKSAEITVGRLSKNHDSSSEDLR